MKKLLALASLALALAATLGCEQQTWEQTKMFNQNRRASHEATTGHGSAHGGAHGAGAAEPAAAHAETPAAAH